jgi:NTP pyrophosphatase (non-canonical NTP hydrolase)
VTKRPPTLHELTQALIGFRDARDWRQFHSLKNLMVSLNLEAAELLELTQWTSDEDLEAAVNEAGFRAKVADECADVLLYLLLIAERAGFDLAGAAATKIARNEAKYPAEKARGTARKYTEL